MPPKTAKAPKEKKAGKEKKEKGDKKEKKGGAPKSDYAIIFFNGEDSTLDPLLYQFYREALLRERQPIVAIHSETITETILSEKENSVILRAKQQILAGEEPETDTILHIVKEKIEDYQAENDRMLDIKEKNREFDLLQYWKDSGDSEMFEVAAPVPKVKAAKEKPVKPKPEGKGKAKSAEPEKPPPQPPLERVNLPEFVLKNWCALPLRGQNSNKKVYIEDSPAEGPKLYVIIVGIYDKGLVDGLLKTGYPVTIVIKFKTTEEFVETNPKYAQFWNDIERTRAEEYNKTVGFYTIITPNVPEKVLKSRSKQVSKELCCLIYDSTDWRRQHLHYFNNMVEIDVAEKNPCLDLLDQQLYGGYFADMNLEDIRVEHVLEALLLRVEELSPEIIPPLVTTPSEASLDEFELIENEKDLKPFYCHVDNKIIVEHNDGMFRRMPEDDSEFAHYMLGLTAIQQGYNLDRFLPETEQVDIHLPLSSKEANLKLLNFEYFLNVAFIKGIEAKTDEVTPDVMKLVHVATEVSKRNVEFPEFVELLSPQALQQLLVECLDSFEFVKQEFNPATSSAIVTFYNGVDPLNRSSSERTLVTKLCFRDFIEYVKGEEQEWLLDQEALYVRSGTDHPTSGPYSKKDVNFYMNIEADEFMINRSLKKHGNLGFTGDSEPPSKIKTREIESDAEQDDGGGSGKKKKKKSPKKSITTMSINKESSVHLATENPDEVQVKAFTGYNVEDLRVQLNSETTVYRSAICTVRHMLDRWMNHGITLNVELTVNGIGAIFGQQFSLDEKPLQNISMAQIKLEDASMITLDVVGTLRRQTSTLDAQDSRELVLRITKPNGLLFTTVLRPSDVVVEQAWAKPRYGEEKRVFYPNGCIVIYGIDGKIRLITANGMMAETGVEEEWDQDPVAYVKPRTSAESVNDKSALPQDVHIDAINLIFDLLPTPESSYFKFTASSGKVYVVQNGNIVRELRSLYIKETTDLIKDELYVRREDDFKMLYTADQLVCLYPDGTEITTTYYEQVVPASSTEELPSVESIAKTRSSLTSRRKSLTKTKSQSKEGSLQRKSLQSENSRSLKSDTIEKPKGDPNYQSLFRSYTIIHERYEKIYFDNQNSLLLIPNRSIEYTRLKITATLKPTVQLNCDVSGLELIGTHCGLHAKSSTTKIWFSTAEELILRNDDGFLSEYMIHQNGRYELISPEVPPKEDSVICPCSSSKIGSVRESAYSANGQTVIKCPCSVSLASAMDVSSAKEMLLDLLKCSCPDAPRPSIKPEPETCPCTAVGLKKTRQFVIKQNWIGYEIKSDSINGIVDENKDESTILFRTNDTVSILTPVKEPPPLDEGIKSRELHDIPCCEPEVDLTVSLMRKIPNKMLLRHFVKVVPHTEDEIRNIVTPLVDPAQSIFRRLRAENNVSIKSMLCVAANNALTWFLAHEEVVHITKSMPIKIESKGYKARLAQIQDDDAKAHLYRKMLKHDYKPMFHKFAAAKLHVRNLPVEEILKDIEKWLNPSEPFRITVNSVDDKSIVPPVTESISVDDKSIVTPARISTIE